MEFKHMEIKEFNKKYGTSLKEEQIDNGDFYDEILDMLNSKTFDVDYFSASFNKSDIIDDIESEKNIAKNLNLELIEIENVYMAIY